MPSHRAKKLNQYTDNCDLSQEERLHWPGEGHVHVSVCFEDDVIMALKEEVSALKLQLSQKKQGDPDGTHRLCCLESDIKEKKDQIQQLKEQVFALLHFTLHYLLFCDCFM